MTTEQEKEYQAFLEKKKQTRVESGFEVKENDLNPREQYVKNEE